MTTEQNKMESAEQAPVQKELELDMEPITPKKHPTAKPTLLEKAKGIFSGLSKKNSTNETNFSVRKEPTIASPTTNIETEQKTQETIIPVITIGSEQNTMTNETQEAQTAQANEIDQPNISAEATKTVQENLKKPENWSVLGALPPKYRRIFIALLIAVLVLLIISWLKPSSDVVQSFEQPKGNAIPTQFQSLDQSQPIEHNVLDQLNNPSQNTQVVESENQSQTEAKANEQVTIAEVSQNTVIETPIVAEQQANNIVSETIAQPAMKNEQLNIPVTKPVEKPAVIEKPKAVEQPKIVEKTKNVEKPHVQERAKTAEKTKTVEKTKIVEKAKVVESKPPVKAEKKGAPIVEAKPAATTKTQKATTQSSGNSTSKTLSVPQGVSLMQVFRNHNLNISDVNAMTKASGAGNALSSFKPGDKVQVSLNSQGRVNELRLSNGARFIRQADGSYQFKK